MDVKDGNINLWHHFIISKDMISQHFSLARHSQKNTDFPDEMSHSIAIVLGLCYSRIIFSQKLEISYNSMMDCNSEIHVEFNNMEQFGCPSCNGNFKKTQCQCLPMLRSG